MSKDAATRQATAAKSAICGEELIISDVAGLLACSETQARLAVDGVLRVIGDRARLDRKVLLRGFGTFGRDAAWRLQFKAASTRKKGVE